MRVLVCLRLSAPLGLLLWAQANHPWACGGAARTNEVLKWGDGSPAQRPSTLAQLAASVLYPPLPWALPHDNPALFLAALWDEPIDRNGTAARRLQLSLRNAGSVAVNVEAVTLLSLSPTETDFYGEAFQMLSQTEGTLRDPIDVGPFTDRGHYRMGIPDHAVDLYGLLHLSSKVISGGHSKMDHLVFSFTSCLRFVGKFLLSERSLDVVLDLEGLPISPGQTVQLEDLLVLYTRAPTEHSMKTRFSLFGMAGRALLETHLTAQEQGLQGTDGPSGDGLCLERDSGAAVTCASTSEAWTSKTWSGKGVTSTGRVAGQVTGGVTGWCSWYALGPHLRVQDLLSALRQLHLLRRAGIQLQYLQIDDGYQKQMGDWLSASDELGVPVPELLDQLAESAAALDLALWVAPFVASASSDLFREHPDWFVRHLVTNAPLSSDEESFGGWRQAPWFALDACKLEVQQHLERLFRHLHSRWNIRYFKLDALFWGALHNGARHEATGGCTRIEAYRMGLSAMRRGAPGAFFVGANHPIWASVGLLEASRLSSDVYRDFGAIRSAARQSLLRSWQHGLLWQGDPDVALLGAGIGGQLPLSETLFAASVVVAVGGLALSGDILESLSPQRVAILRRLTTTTYHVRSGSTEWEDETLRAGLGLWDQEVLAEGVTQGQGQNQIPDRTQRRPTARPPEKILFLFNWDDSTTQIKTMLLAACHSCVLVDFWYDVYESGREEGVEHDEVDDVPAVHNGGQLIRVLAPRSARIYLITEI